MDFLKVFIGILALFLAWAIVFKTRIIFRFNNWIRENVFTDDIVIFSGRRIAVLLLIMGGLALFSGIANITDNSLWTSKREARMMKNAETLFIEEKYAEVIELTENILNIEPDNLRALELMAGSFVAIGEKEKGIKIKHQVKK